MLLDLFDALFRSVFLLLLGLEYGTLIYHAVGMTNFSLISYAY